MELPSLMTAGRWKSSRMPGQYNGSDAARLRRAALTLAASSLEPVTLPLAYSLLYFSAVVTNGRCWFVSFQVLGCIRALILS